MKRAIIIMGVIMGSYMNGVAIINLINNSENVRNKKAIEAAKKFTQKRNKKFTRTNMIISKFTSFRLYIGKLGKILSIKRLIIKIVNCYLT